MAESPRTTSSTGESPSRAHAARVFRIATTLHQRGKGHEAEQLYRSVLDLEPDDVGSPNNLALQGLGRLEEAVAHDNMIGSSQDLSGFSILFAGDQPYSYDVAELGRNHAGYQALMTHWRKVLPDGVMLEVNYEDVGADLEGQARGIVAHCGLDWKGRNDWSGPQASSRSASRSIAAPSAASAPMLTCSNHCWRRRMALGATKGSPDGRIRPH